MTFEELKDKALSLPFAPGVYIMRDAGNKVIYVGKAKKLKNRVSQYFQDSAAHTPKTRAMVSKIDHFDVIVAASEFEALVLECSLIKRYLPKYNILLKDDKGYPYLRLDMSEEYPRITVVHKLAHDGAAYFGPYGSWGVTPDLEAAELQQAVSPGPGEGPALPELPHEPMPRLVPAEPEPGGLPGCHGAGPAAAHRELPEAGPGAAGTDAGGLGGAEI